MVNNQIRATQIRLIDETGKQIGIVSLVEALQSARERNLDLIQVTTKAEPPVCKIMDYGKFLYSLQKKEKIAIKRVKGVGELKGIRVGFNISPHDMKVKGNLAEKFLKKGNKVRVELILRGREKAFGDLAREKISRFLETLNESYPIKIERELKREPRGFSTIISKG